MLNLRMAETIIQIPNSYTMPSYQNNGNINDAQTGCWFMPAAYNIINRPTDTYFLIVYKNGGTQKVDIAMGIDFFCIRVNNYKWYKYSGTII